MTIRSDQLARYWPTPLALAVLAAEEPDDHPRRRAAARAHPRLSGVQSIGGCT